METVKIINCRTLSQVSVGDNLVLRPLGNAAYAKKHCGGSCKGHENRTQILRLGLMFAHLITVARGWWNNG